MGNQKLEIFQYADDHAPTHRPKNLGNDVKIKEHHKITIVSIYDRMLWRKIGGLEEEIIGIRSKRGEVSNDISEKSLQRSFAILRDYSLSNYQHFKSFITLTFADNVTDLSIANDHLQNWVRKVQRVYPAFMYLGVPEYQKRGAVHYHLMTNIPIGSDILPKRERIWTYNNIKDKYYALDYYDLLYWNDKNGKLGNSSAFDLELTDDKFSITAYLAKYFFKEKDNRLFNRCKVLHSNNLEKPTILRLTKESKEFENYMEYLCKSMNKISQKTIISYDRLKPTVTICEFKK